MRVQAAALNAALRIATEDIAASVAERPGPRLVDDLLARLSTAVRAATRGVVGDALDGTTTQPTAQPTTQPTAGP